MQASRLIALFLITPIIVRGLGQELYGAWRMMQAAIGYMTLGTVGATNPLKWTLAKDLSSEDLEAKKRQIGATLAICIRLAPILLVIGGLLVGLSPWFIKVESSNQIGVRLAMGLLSLGLILQLFVSIPSATLRGMNLEFRAMGPKALASAVPVVMGGCAVLAGMGLPGVAGGHALGLVVIGLTGWWIAKRVLPWFGANKPNKEDVRKILGLSWFFFIWILTRRVLLTCDVLIIGFVLLPAAATQYSLTKFGFTALIGPMSAVLGSIMPGVGDLVGRDDWERVARIRQEGLGLVWLVATTAGVAITVLNRSFLGLWVGKENYAGDLINVGLVVVGIEYVVLWFDSSLIDTTLDVSRKTLVGAVAAVATIGIGYVMTDRFGFAGMIMALALVRLCLAWYYSFLMRRKISYSVQRRPSITLRPGLVCVAMLGGAFMVGRHCLLTSWIGLIFFGVGCAVVSGFTFWFLGLSGAIRSSVAGRIHTLIRSKLSVSTSGN